MNFGLNFSILFLCYLAWGWEAVERHEAAERADKEAWREREGWCTAEEAQLILSGTTAAHFEFIVD